MAYIVNVSWKKRADEMFVDNKYKRAHLWSFDGGIQVPASASPHVVPLPLSSEAAVDPEEAFVASLSSCHMLWFLSLAAERGIVVESYEDNAEGVMGKNEEGRVAMTKVTLKPRVAFGGPQPSRPDLEELHHAAHEKCFLAASVRTLVTVEPQ